jgi:hypothetical protein
MAEHLARWVRSCQPCMPATLGLMEELKAQLKAIEAALMAADLIDLPPASEQPEKEDDAVAASGSSAAAAPQQQQEGGELAPPPPPDRINAYFVSPTWAGVMLAYLTTHSVLSVLGRGPNAIMDEGGWGRAIGRA